MGTIGLSFGSPTSGTGFDVEKTVSTIVTNLQKVEQPWKDQLGKLQNQDTALSNLGTLLSTLSTDVGNLTNFSGVLAQKTGSSSDTNVLQLMSATSAAVAGTHTVIVNSLAKTSSGYLTMLSNASDVLSGSLTIGVGGGTAHTIDVSSNQNTVSGLAAAINAAQIGVTASVLTDSKGTRLSLMSNTAGSAGELTVSSSIVDTSQADAPLAYNSVVQGADASLTIDGIDLTSPSNTVTNLIPGVTFQLLAPSAATSSSSAEEVQVVIGNDTSGATSAVSAVVNDYNALVSAIDAQEGNDSSGNPEPLFGSPTISLLLQQLMGGLNAQNPNGYLTAVSSTAPPTLSGSISIQVGTGTAQTIQVPTADTSLQGLTDAINNAQIGVVAAIATQNGQSSLTLRSQMSGSPGTLTVSSSITAASGSTSTPLRYTNSSDVGSLAALGITASVKGDGTLSFDASVLDSCLNADFAGVVGFFQNANSWGQSFANVLKSAGSSSSSGILTLAQKANSSMEKSLNDSVARQEDRITKQKALITAQLEDANQILQSIPGKLDEVNMIYSAISGYKPNS